MNDEQRRYERIPTDFLVTITIPDTGVPMKGSSMNLSRGGMFIGMEKPLPRGTRVKLVLHLDPIGETVMADATVVWARPSMPDPQFPPGIGVKFSELTEETLQAIDRVIEKMSGR